MKNLKQVFLEKDIFPLGNFETLPIDNTMGGADTDYPNVIRIGDVPEYESLLKEAIFHIEKAGATYVKDRLNQIPEGMSEDDLRDVLGGVGFVKGAYQSFSLRKYGTAVLEDWIKPSTRDFIENLGVSTFRQQYAVAYGGWNVKLHRDHKDFLTHGFRLMVPLNSCVYMGYEDDNGNALVYKLEPGGMYFVNIATMHRGFNESLEEQRINLIMQMTSDKLLEGKKAMEPINATELIKLPYYSIEYDVWDFGYEL